MYIFSGDPEDASPNVIWCCELLKRLDLSHNRLRALPDMFKKLKRLNTLIVSYNYLNELPSSCSLGCVNLVSSLSTNMYIHLRFDLPSPYDTVITQ